MDKEPINVIWKSYHQPEIIARGYWDQGLLEDIFKLGAYEHFTDFGDIPPDEGAIVIINGRTHFEDVEQINKDLARLHWVVLLVTGDEEGQFPWQQVRHPLLRTWMMLPRMNLHNDVSFKMANGYRPETRQYLKEIGQPKKIYDFMFIGQINHARREQALEAARAAEPQYATYIVPTDGFGKEVVTYKDYLNIMAQSKVVLCPSGIESPDNFRLYEALEAGCLPVVDAFSTNNQDWGFWQYLFGLDIPFPIVPYWDELPNLLPELLKAWPANANRAFGWWQLYKRNMRLKLLDDIKELTK